MSFCLFFLCSQSSNEFIPLHVEISLLTFQNPKDIFSCFIRILFLRCDILNRKPIFNHIELAFFFLIKNGRSTKLLPSLWTCHFFFFYFFLELVKEWVANSKKYSFSLADTSHTSWWYLFSQKIGNLYQTFQKFEWTHQWNNDEN